MEDPQQQQIKDLASAEENITTTTPFLRNSRRRIHARIIQSKFHCRRQRCCVSSNAAILILVWNLILVACLESFLDPNFFGMLFDNTDDYNTGIIMYSVAAFLFLFYPLAGCLADIRWGKYKTVVYSVSVIWGSIVAMVVLGGVASASMIPEISRCRYCHVSSKYHSTHHAYSYHCSIWNTYSYCSSTYTLWSYLFQC